MNHWTELNNRKSTIQHVSCVAQGSIFESCQALLVPTEEMGGIIPINIYQET